MIELRVLGTLDLRDGESGRPIAAVLAQPKRTALLAYLAAAAPRGPQSRDTLLLLFWPESSQDRARNSLNQAVFNLRRTLGESALVTAGETVQLNDGSVWCDAAAYDAALREGDRATALELYRGDLLPGFHIDDCPEFDQWLTGERVRLRRSAASAAVAVADGRVRDGDLTGAIELLQRAAAWGDDQKIIERLVTLLAGSGDAAGALREYERFRAKLHAELGIDPSPGLRSLAERVRKGDVPAQESRLPELDTRLPAAAPDTATSTPAAVARASSRGWRSPAVAAIAATMVFIGVAAAWLAWSAPAMGGAGTEPVALDSRRVLVSAFENRTGEQSLDPLGYMASDWISQGIARSALARVVPFSTVVQETPYLGMNGTGAVAAANRQLAHRIGAGLLVAGAFYRAGDSLAFQAQIVDVRSGEILRALDGVRGTPLRPEEAADELQRRMLGAIATLLDERLESWPDAGSQPTSLAAYQLFADGMRTFLEAAKREFGSAEAARGSRLAADRFMAAVNADTAFTTALVWAGYGYQNARDTAAARIVVSRLEQRQLSPWAKAVLDHQHAGLARDSEAAYTAALQLADLSPDSEWLFKLGVAALETERYKTARSAFLRVDPTRGWIRDWPSYWRLRTEVQHVVGDPAAALADARAGLGTNPSEPWLRTQELWALASLGRGNELFDALAPPLAAGDRVALWRLHTSVDELLAHGHRTAARRLAQRALSVVDSALRISAQPAARAEFAYLAYQAGRRDDALREYEALVSQLAAVGEHRVRHAIVAADAGDRTQAVETLRWLSSLSGEELRAAAPRENQLWGSPEAWASLASARLAVAAGDRASALTFIQQARARGLRHSYLHLHAERQFASLQRDPAFAALLKGRE
jgi:DNA-binding SARP family transcriptional activator/tetratricopeptide (TPR) repeat protein/TolB-like protein